MMVAHHAIPVPPLVHGQSKVSHKLRLSQQERIKHRLTIFAFFVACLTGLFLFVNIVSSPEARFPASRDEYRSRVVSGSDRIRSLSASWAYYSPYHPAAEFDGSTRKGCVVSQANIVSSQFGSTLIDPTVDPLRFITPSGFSQLQRHGARYPTSGATRSIVKALEKLQAVATYDDPRLHFMKKYAYDLGLDDLVKYGAHQYVIGFGIFLCVLTFTSLSPLGLTLWERKLSTVIGVCSSRAATFPS